MVRQVYTTAVEPNPDFVEQPRNKGEDNLTWGSRAVAAMSTAGPKEWTYLALLGGNDTMAFRLRVAQSVLRRDMLPSFWSDAVLVELKSDSLRNAEATHVPLVQPGGAVYAPYDNGVVSCPLERFKDEAIYPNIALIALPVPQSRIMERVKAFKRSRSTLDALEHVLRWLAFCWGVARTSNPLNENYGIPSACMLETVCAAEDYDLTPGLESRASCPEAIWSAATYWRAYYAKTSGDNGKVPCGRFSTDHTYSILEPEDRSVRAPRRPGRTRGGPTTTPRKAAKKSRR